MNGQQWENPDVSTRARIRRVRVETNKKHAVLQETDQDIQNYRAFKTNVFHPFTLYHVANLRSTQYL